MKTCMQEFTMSAGRFTEKPQPVTFKRFTRNDWYGWCDAQPFEDGSAPFIAEWKFSDTMTAVIIADFLGIHIECSETETSFDVNYSYTKDLDTFEETLRDLFLLLEVKGNPTREVLTELGFFDVAG